MDQTSPSTTTETRADFSAEALSPNSEVTNDEQFLIQTMRELGHGRVEELHVRNGAIRVTSKTKFYELVQIGRNRTRRFSDRRQFAHLHHQHDRLLSDCRDVIKGQLERVDFADGLPVSWTPI